MASDRKAMLQKLRERLLKKKGGFKRDPFEWKPPQVGPNEELRVKAYILPPVEKGEKCASGVAQIGMDGLFFTQVGDHWINNKKYPCPRVYDNDDCPYCQLGFDLLSSTESKSARSEISRAYLPRTQYACNLYFPNVKTNPEELRGKVMFYAMPKTIFDKLEECIARDDAGEDPDDPHPWGIFYDPLDAYPLLIVVNRKGDYNSYVDSKLLAGGRGRIAETDEEIEDILNRRHDVPSKYPPRTPENLKALQSCVDSILNGDSSSGKDSGFDTDEVSSATSTSSSKPSSPQPAKADPPPKEESPVSSDLDEVEDDELNALLNSLKRS